MTYDSIWKPTRKGIAIVPGHPQKSQLVARITSTDVDVRMPPPDANKELTPEEIGTLTRWIKEGANWSRHWSFLPPRSALLPDVANNSWPRNEIDHFVLARLDREGLLPAPEADRPSLIRRATLDLTGLPPTLEEVDAFLDDRSPNAYERVVERLLARLATASVSLQCGSTWHVTSTRALTTRMALLPITPTIFGTVTRIRDYAATINASQFRADCDSTH